MLLLLNYKTKMKQLCNSIEIYCLTVSVLSKDKIMIKKHT